MFVPFDKLPETSRIWIYQSDRKFTPDEKNTISNTLQAFTNQWTAHNQTLGASFAIMHDQFIVLGVDENYNEASGCSIDASVHAIKNLGTTLNLDFFTRTKIAFWNEDEIRIIPLFELSEGLARNMWNSQTEVFNNTITSKGEMKSGWKIPAGQSWLKRYLTRANCVSNN